MKTKRYVICPKCRAANSPAATLCWLCASGFEAEPEAGGEPTGSGASSAGPYRTAAERTKGPGPDTTRSAWSITLAVTVLVSLAITAELARVAPGLLVLFLLVDVPVLAALLRTVTNARVSAPSGGEFVILEDTPATATQGTFVSPPTAPTRDTSSVELPEGAGVFARITAALGEGLGCIFIMLAGLGLLTLALIVILMLVCAR